MSLYPVNSELNTAPIRVLFVIPTLDQSGAEKQLALLASGLPREQFVVQVIALNRAGYYADFLKEQGISVETLGKRWRIDPFAHYRLKQKIQSFAPDIVHGWLFSANSHVRLLKGKKASWKAVVSERCVDTWKAGWQLFLDRKLISRTDALLANSESVAEFYRGIGVPDSLIRVIPNGIRQTTLATLPSSQNSQDDQSSLERATARREWRKKLGWPEDAYVIGSIGRLARQKKTETLLWAMHMLKQAEPGTRALFVGSGPEIGRLQELAEKYEVTEFIRFVGHRQDAEELHQYWDAFWLASDFEGQSNSLMEAMAAGVPVVASDIPPNRELVSHEQTGFIAPVGDSAAFALAIRRLINNPELSQQLSQNARAVLAERHSIEVMVKSHLDLYRELLGRPSSETS